MYTFSFIVGSIIPKSVKCNHSATKAWNFRPSIGGSVIATVTANGHRSVEAQLSPFVHRETARSGV